MKTLSRLLLVLGAILAYFAAFLKSRASAQKIENIASIPEAVAASSKFFTRPLTLIEHLTIKRLSPNIIHRIGLKFA